jgi:hypothetical protein
MLNEALHAFLASLNEHTLQDILKHGGRHKLANAFATFIEMSR